MARQQKRDEEELDIDINLDELPDQEDIDLSALPDQDDTPITEPKVAGVPQEEKSWWDTINTNLTDAPSRFVRENITPAFQSLRQNIENPNLAGVVGFYEGAAEGAGDFISDMTSPLSLGLEIAGGGLVNRFRKAKRGLEQVTKTIRGKSGVTTITAPKTAIDELDALLKEEADLGVTPRTRPPSAEAQAGTRPIDVATETTTTGKGPVAKSVTKQGDPGSVVTKDKPRRRFGKKEFFVNEDGSLSPVDNPAMKIRPKTPLPSIAQSPKTRTKSPVIKEDDEAPGALRQLYDLARGSLSVDLPFITSAGLRQAMPHVGTKNWFKAWVPQAKAFGSEVASKAHMDEIRSRELFRPKKVPQEDGTIKELPSYAEEAGLRFTEKSKYSKREEALRTGLAEKIPGFGRWVRASNRSYGAFLNDLRANAFQDLIENARKTAKDPTMDPDANALLRKEIAEFVNNSTGAGSLDFGAGINLEAVAPVLSNVMFSARNTASRIQMMNPRNYLKQEPQVRKQYINGLLRTAAFWTSASSLARLGGAEVSLNPTSSDFGKIKIGNTRLDPGGGFQQILTLLARQGLGGSTSSTRENAQFEPFGEKFGRDTAGSSAARWATNKAHPTLGLAWALWNSSKQSPVDVPDRMLQTYIPMVAQDAAELLQEDQSLALMFPALLAGSAGIGAQSYGQEFNEPKFIDTPFDISGRTPIDPRAIRKYLPR